ncbi:MAG: tetratricopeptide repeat protein [Candidatus Latescibacteria bacterium]|nr:tetratricopeptide repeat protein [Candidatus Latescibacterota bacterium]
MGKGVLSRHTESVFLLGLFLGALALRLLYLSEIQHSPFYDAPVVDAKVFLEQARQIAAGQFWGRPEPFWQPPLYTYFLAGICWLFPASYFTAIRLAQMLLGSGSCLLTYLVARRVLPPGPARLAGILAAAYSMFFYYEGELLAVPLEVFLDLLLLHRLQEALQSGRGRDWAAAGALAGLAALARPNILLFVGALLLWWGWCARRADPAAWHRPLARRWAQFLLPLLLVVLPVSLRNYLVGGEWTFISTNGGVNFYLGNNPDYDRTVAIHPGRQWEDLVMEPVRAGLTRAGEKSAYFYGKAFDYILAQPLDWLGLLLKKTYLFWSGPELKRNQDIYYARRHSLLLSTLLWDRLIAFPFGLLGPLGLLGLAWSWRRPEFALLCLYVLAYTASVVLFFVAARYRMPVLPVLLIFAAAALAELWAVLQHPTWPRLARGALPLLALLVLLNLRPASDPERDAQLYCDLGEIHLRNGRYEQAVQHSLRALEIEPDYDYARHNLATAYLYQERYAEAIREGLRAAQDNPGRPDTRILLGQAYTALGQFESAALHLRQALQADSSAGMARYHYGRLLLKQDQPVQALPHLVAARQWQPGDFWICYELGRAYQASGQPAQALQIYQQALAIENRPEALNAIGAVHLLRGDLEQANRYFAQTLDLDPGNLEAQINTGLLELRAGQLRRALARLEDLLATHPSSPALYRALIETYAQTGQPQRAGELQRRLEELAR